PAYITIFVMDLWPEIIAIIIYITQILEYYWLNSNGIKGFVVVAALHIFAVPFRHFLQALLFSTAGIDILVCCIERVNSRLPCHITNRKKLEQ
ncbi:hypothetical protein ACJX0J_029946, partial [Zea mays]